MRLRRTRRRFVVRAPWNDTVVIKRLLDVGVQSLLLPYVQNEEEAKRAVAAVRYPPRGVRGVSTNSRANRFGRVTDYFKRAGRGDLPDRCRSRRAQRWRRSNRWRRSTASTACSSARRTWRRTLAISPIPPIPRCRLRSPMRSRGSRRPARRAGILAFAEADAKRWIEHGARFVAVTSDQFLLARETVAVAAKYKS